MLELIHPEDVDMAVISLGDQPNQISVVQQLGRRIGQGFPFARPLPHADREMAFRAESVVRATAERSAGLFLQRQSHVGDVAAERTT